MTLLEYTYTDARGDRYRIMVEPARGGSWRYEYDWTGCSWRLRGREPVEDVAVTVDA